MSAPPRMLFRPNERFLLDAASPVPLYHQIERILLERIQRSDDAVGSMLPAEKDLMAMFRVSRATVKKAFDALVARGMVERRRALGTRVVARALVEDLARLSSYTEEMERQGLEVSSIVLEARVHQPEPAVRARLGLDEGEPTLLIRRLRGTSERFPVVLLASELPARLGIDPHDDFCGSLYRLLEDQYGVTIEWADEVIRAAAAADDEARQLGIASGSAVLVMERLAYGRDGRPIEFVRGVYRPERYQFSIRLRR